MHNASFPLQVDETVHPRYVGDSFLKLLLPVRRSLSSSAPESTLGVETQCPIAIVFRNVGDAALTFKVAAARRAHAAEEQENDAAYADLADYSGSNAITVVAGGYVGIVMPTLGYNLFAFIMTSGGPTVVKVEASSQNQLMVWKALERETEKGTHLDTFLDDDGPKVFYSNSSPSSGL